MSSHCPDCGYPLPTNKGNASLRPARTIRITRNEPLVSLGASLSHLSERTSRIARLEPFVSLGSNLSHRSARTFRIARLEPFVSLGSNLSHNPERTSRIAWNEPLASLGSGVAARTGVPYSLARVGHTHSLGWDIPTKMSKSVFSLRGNVVLDLSVLLGRKRTPHQTGVSSLSL